MKIKLTDNEKFCIAPSVNEEFNDVLEIERSIITKFRKTIWTPFIKGVKEYEMIQEGDSIAICISGGKDSLLLAKCMQELQKHSKINFDVKYIAMNPGFNKNNNEILLNAAKKLNINLQVFDTEIFSIIEKIAKDYPCYMCARMRRGALYDYAQSIGCNKIALGHHYDDMIETIMLNVLYAGSYKAMLPKIKAKNYENMELIRPLIYVRESDIIKFTKYNSIKAMNCGCVVAAQKTSSKRAEVKELLKQLREINPEFDKSIFASSKNVNLETILGWTSNGKKSNYLDEY